MKNLEKIKLENSQPPSPPFKRTFPYTVLPPPFFNFPSPPGEVIKIYFPSLKERGGGSELWKLVKPKKNFKIFFRSVKEQTLKFL